MLNSTYFQPYMWDEWLKQKYLVLNKTWEVNWYEIQPETLSESWSLSSSPMSAPNMLVHLLRMPWAAYICQRNSEIGLYVNVRFNSLQHKCRNFTYIRLYKKNVFPVTTWIKVGRWDQDLHFSYLILLWNYVFMARIRENLRPPPPSRVKVKFVTEVREV